MSAGAYDDVLPYFRKSEDNERGASDLHGADGPLGGVQCARRASARARLRRGRAAMRLSAQRRFQRRNSGRRGPLPDHHPQRPCGHPRRGRTCSRRAAARISRSCRTRSPRALRSTGRRAIGVEYEVGSEKRTARAVGRGDRLVRHVQLAAAAAAFRDSDRRRCCNRSAFRSSPTCPGVGDMASTTTTPAGSCCAVGSRSRSTTPCAAGASGSRPACATRSRAAAISRCPRSRQAASCARIRCRRRRTRSARWRCFRATRSAGICTRSQA